MADQPKPIILPTRQNGNKLLVDLVDVETEIHSTITAIRAMLLCDVTHNQREGQIQLIKTMLDCSLRSLAANSLRYEGGKLLLDDPNGLPY